MFAPPFPRRRHAINRPVALALAARQRADDHAFLVEHVEMTPLHRFDVIITTHLLAAALAFFRPKSLGLFHANHKGLLLLFKFRSDHFPTLAQTQQLMKRFFWRHHPMLVNSNLSIH